jgi:hypothetical protein
MFASDNKIYIKETVSKGAGELNTVVIHPADIKNLKVQFIKGVK